MKSNLSTHFGSVVLEKYIQQLLLVGEYTRGTGFARYSDYEAIQHLGEENLPPASTVVRW